MQDIYNILAGSIRKILDNWNSRDIQDFNSITDETFINYKKSIYYLLWIIALMTRGMILCC